MPNLVNQRLTALLHQQRIKLLSRTDRLVFRVGRLYNRMGRDLLRAVAVPEDDTSERVDAIMDDAFEQVDALIRTDFRAEVLNSHRAAADSFIAAVPRRWFRKLHPFVLETTHLSYGQMLVALPQGRTIEAEEPVFDWGPLTKSRKREIIDELIFPGPTPERVDELLGHVGPGGMKWDERLKHWNDQARGDIRATLSRTLGDPDTIGIAATRKALMPSVGNVRYKAQRIARTEGRRIAELGQQEAIDEVSELIAGKQIIATLDAATRPEHAARHGRVYRQQPDGSYVSDAGQTLPDLPDEPNGRCWAAAILRMPAELENDPEVVALLKNVSGDVVNDPSAYDDWFANATEKERRRTVGAKKYRIVQGRTQAHGREPQWRDFLDPDAELSSIETLQRQPWDAWQDRRAKVDLMITDRTRILRQVAATGFELPATVARAKSLPAFKQAAGAVIDQMSHNDIATYLTQFNTGIGATFGREVVAALEVLPTEDLRLLAHSGQGVRTGLLVTDIRPDLKGRTPSGWATGTFDSSDGIYDPDGRNVILPEFRLDEQTGARIPSRPPSLTLAHEVGHAIDSGTARDFSQHREFQTVWRAELKAVLDAGSPGGMDYVIQGRSVAGAREAFAEAYAAGSSPNGQAILGDLFHEAFPRTIAVVRELVDDLIERP